MSIVRRVLVLGAISVAGIGLLAPLGARSATPVPVDLADHLLTVESAPRIDVERGTLVSRIGGTSLSTLIAPSPGIDSEQLASDAMPTPASAPMEATLQVVPTPVPTPAPPPPPQRVVTYDGDTVWDRLAQCESGGNWAINTGNGYYGGLQFNYATWHGYDGGQYAEYPHEATRAEQIIVAERLHAARGFQPWPACRIKLGLP
jgi:hypothetical protein